MCKWVSGLWMSQPGSKKSVFSFLSREMMQGPSGFISASTVIIVLIENIANGQRSRFWKDRDPECYPHLQTKPLPENPPLMKWTGQCNKAWAKHLLADYYYIVNKGRRRMRMPHYMSHYFLDYSDVQWSNYLILQCFYTRFNLWL